MNNRTKIYLFGGVVLVMIAFVWLSQGGPSSGNENQKGVYTSTSWSDQFGSFSKDPRGLYLFNTLLDAHLDSAAYIYEVTQWYELDSVLTFNKAPKTFMFIGNFVGMKNSEVKNLIKDVQSNGSTIFLSYNKATNNIPPYFFNNYELRFDYSTSENVYAGYETFEMVNVYQNDTIASEWNAFGDIVTKDSSQVLSTFMEMPNFIKILSGKGQVLLHTNPGMYFNYQLKRDAGYRYTNYTLSHIPKSQDVIILELSRMSDLYGQYQDGNENEDGKKDDSYLRLLFTHPMLLTALLLSLFGILLFMLFRTKRRQPIVPFVGKKKDMTLAFTDTITSIYFSKRNPYSILQIQKKNFYANIQKHFFVDLSKKEYLDKTIQILAEKSNQPAEDIKRFVQELETKEPTVVNEDYITRIGKQQQVFYRETGIITDRVIEKVEQREMTFNRSLILPTLMVLVGILSILIGFYFLVISKGIGIVLWPVGIVLLILGIIRITNPYLVIRELSITYYSSLGRKTTFERDDLNGIEMKETGVILKFTEGRSIIINYRDLSRFDREQFDRFLSKLHTLAL